MSERNEVFEVIKSVITSQKGGVLLKNLNRDYRNLAGEHIPYKSLGYQSIEEVLHDIPEVYSFVNDEGQLVFTNRGKNCEHLVELISKQKSTKSSKLKLYNKDFVQKPRKPRHSMVGELVHQKPHRVIEHENSAKFQSASHELPRKERVMKEKYEHFPENDNDVQCMMKRNVSSRTELWGKKYTSSAEKLSTASFKQKNVEHTRKSEAHFHTDFGGERRRHWKPRKGHYDESSQLEHWQYDSHDPPLCQEDRIYLYKSSKLLDQREASSHDARYKFYDIGCDMTNSYTPSGNYVRPKSFRASRANLLVDYPNPLYRDEGFDSPSIKHHSKYSKNPYGSYGLWDSRNVPEIDDWDVNIYHSHGYGGRPEMDGGLWQERYDACEHSGRKIDIIDGSLRVTIKNFDVQ